MQYITLFLYTYINIRSEVECRVYHIFRYNYTYRIRMCLYDICYASVCNNYCIIFIYIHLYIYIYIRVVEMEYDI